MIQMIIFNGFSGINVQKLPENAHILRNDDFQFLRTAKELWLRITTTQITDLLPVEDNLRAQEVFRARLISHFNGSFASC